MPTPTKGRRLGGGPAHERLMLANLATALFEHGRITTTEAKAKRLRPLAERLVTFAKRGDIASRRRVLTVVKDKSVVHELFTEIAPRYANRHGGYTRIVKLGPRKGDNAPMAVIELVEPLAEQTVAEATAATKRAAKDRAAEEAKVEAEVADLAAESAADAALSEDAAEESVAAAEAGGEAAAAGEAPTEAEAAAADEAEVQAAATGVDAAEDIAAADEDEKKS